MTPAVKALQAAGIEYRLHEYEHEPSAGSYGLEAAHALAQDPARVFKTLVAKLEGGATVVAIVPVASQLDLKALAAHYGVKRAEMATPAEAERATGYVTGGISPLGQRKPLPTVIDESILRFPTVYVSGGKRGLEISLQTCDLLRLTEAHTARIAR